MVREIPVPEFEIPQKIRIMNPRMGLNLLVDAPPGEVLKDLAFLDSCVKRVEEGEEG